MEAPENTLQAFERISVLGDQRIAIQIDVRMTKDGHMLVCYDKDFKRLCGVDKLVSETNLSEIPEAYNSNLIDSYGNNYYKVTQDD